MHMEMEAQRGVMQWAERPQLCRLAKSTWMQASSAGCHKASATALSQNQPKGEEIILIIKNKTKQKRRRKKDRPLGFKQQPLF